MENRVAVFIDFENIKRAVDDYFVNERVDLKSILEEIGRLADGRIVVKRAYADWGYFKDYRSDLLDNATEPVQAFALTYKGKNGADIRIAIDVMDVVLRQSDITHVALVSGDSDFTPLVMKLREFGKYVIGLGVRSNTSNYLAKSCDCFSYYDDLRSESGEGQLPERAVPAEPMDPVALLAVALAEMGNHAVTGSALKTRMRKIDPMFDETRHGHSSFVEFLRAHEDLIDLYKPAVGDLTVAPKGLLDEGREPEAIRNRDRPCLPVPPALAPDSRGETAAPGERYRAWLRDNNFRYVPSRERHEIIRVVYDIFTRPDAADLSLKEAKDRLHLWFEENRPAVSWESINSTVYHLFYTWCFFFDRTDEGDGKPLWDRRTSLQTDIHGADDLIAKCERGIVRKIWEHDREVDPDALNEWLNEGDPKKRASVAELIESIVGAGGAGRSSQTFAGAGGSLS